MLIKILNIEGKPEKTENTMSGIMSDKEETCS